MSNLKSTIEDLASEFANSILAALRAASIDELTNQTGHAVGRRARGARPASGAVENGAVAAKRGPGKRLGRRSMADIGRMVESIVSLLEKTPEGLRAEQIREALGCQAKELPRPLADGLADGRLKKTGQKRATTYFAGSADAGTKRRGRAKRSAKR